MSRVEAIQLPSENWNIMNQKPNKAHTATLNRIAQRYGATPNPQGRPFDIQADGLTIEVETTATIDAGLQKLRHLPGRVYIAVTNKEAIRAALRMTEGTRVGVMDPKGDVLRESEAVADHAARSPLDFQP